VYAAAPRVEERFLEYVVELDDRSLPMAETYRRVRMIAAQMGIPRPSYERVRLHLRATRLRGDERKRARDLALELAFNSRRADLVVADLLALLE
jgi:hypothetical protein